MSGRRAFEPGDPDGPPVDEQLVVPEGWVRDAGGPSPSGAERRPNPVAACLCRAVEAVCAACRVAVAWCIGSPWDRSDATGAGPGARWSGGAPIPLTNQPPKEPDGVHGIPYQAERSPVGAYLWAIVGADPDVEALQLRTDSVSLSLPGYRSPLTVPFPAQVREFVGAFNAHCYPALHAGASEQERRPER